MLDTVFRLLYAVEVVGTDALMVFSVAATVRDVPERATEVFFGRVLDLSLEDAAALDASVGFGRGLAGGRPSWRGRRLASTESRRRLR